MDELEPGSDVGHSQPTRSVVSVDASAPRVIKQGCGADVVDGDLLSLVLVG